MASDQSCRVLSVVRSPLCTGDLLPGAAGSAAGLLLLGWSLPTWLDTKRLTALFVFGLSAPAPDACHYRKLPIHLRRTQLTLALSRISWMDMDVGLQVE